MKVRLRQEELLEDAENHCMKRFKINSIFEAELTNSVFFRTEIPKKIAKLTIEKRNYRFEEWEPGVFEKLFEESK